MPTTPELAIPKLEAGARASTPLTEGIRFGHPVSTVGARWRVTVHAVSRSPDPLGMGAGEQVSTYDSDYSVEVLAVEGPAPSRVRLRFARNVHTYAAKETPTAIEGKAYVVDARAPHVRDAAGAAAPEPEAQRVLDVFPDLGTRARIDEVLPEGAMALGERRDELAAAILRVIHPRAWSLRSGAATLARIDGDDAVFEVSLDATSEGGLRMQVAGEARVRLRDARLEDLSLDGTYDAGAEPKASDGGTGGSFSLRRQARTAESTP